MKYLGEIQRPEILEDQKHRQRKSEIANTVDDESLVAGVGRELLVEIKTDQQVAAQPHAFPPHEQQQVVRRQHQHQHEEHEQVQVREKAVVSALVRDIADGAERY